MFLINTVNVIGKPKTINKYLFYVSLGPIVVCLSMTTYIQLTTLEIDEWALFEIYLRLELRAEFKWVSIKLLETGIRDLS